MQTLRKLNKFVKFVDSTTTGGNGVVCVVQLRWLARATHALTTQKLLACSTVREHVCLAVQSVHVQNVQQEVCMFTCTCIDHFNRDVRETPPLQTPEKPCGLINDLGLPCMFPLRRSQSHRRYRAVWRRSGGDSIAGCQRMLDDFIEYVWYGVSVFVFFFAFARKGVIFCANSFSRVGRLLRYICKNSRHANLINAEYCST